VSPRDRAARAGAPALGISSGVSSSDGSAAAFFPGLDGIQVELYRPGADTYAATLGWYDLLHPEVPDTGAIDSTTAVSEDATLATSWDDLR
jgi:hypothetical protein